MLALASIGPYGLLSYEVTRRTREIGIRMALGAGRRKMLRNVVEQGLALAITGLILGIAASYGGTRYLGSILYDVHPGDPLTLIAVTAILLFVARGVFHSRAPRDQPRSHGGIAVRAGRLIGARARFVRTPGAPGQLHEWRVSCINTLSPKRQSLNNR